MMAEEEYKYKPDYAVPPGATLRNLLDEQNMTQAELARRSGLSEKTISDVVNTRQSLTPQVAERLEYVFELPADFWLRRQASYDATVARLRHMAEHEAETRESRKIPYAELVKRGYVNMTRKIEERYREILRFFRVAELSAIEQQYAAAFRVSSHVDEKKYALACWLRAGEIEAEDIDTRPFDQSLLRKLIPELRQMTKQRPDEFFPHLGEGLAECGIALVTLPQFPGSGAHGATYWTDGGSKAIVLLSLRCRWADIFWFSMFHELGHLLLHPKDAYIQRGDSDDEKERDADRFAADILNPPSEYTKFERRGIFNESAIRLYARQVGIHPGVVVGRLHHDKHIPMNRFNYLRIQYKWKGDDHN